jgi:hypothetical protein
MRDIQGRRGCAYTSGCREYAGCSPARRRLLFSQLRTGRAQSDRVLLRRRTVNDGLPVTCPVRKGRDEARGRAGQKHVALSRWATRMPATKAAGALESRLRAQLGAARAGNRATNLGLPQQTGPTTHHGLCATGVARAGIFVGSALVALPKASTC